MIHLKSCGALVALALIVACGSSSSDGPSECNPLGGPACMMPWPSAAYLADDATSATGYRLELPAEAMPVNIDEVPILPTLFNSADGFSVSGPMLVAFETGVSDEGLPHHSDLSASMDPNASVVVVNMETGERLTIFAEPDMNAAVPEERALIIRPMDRMQSGTRYAVGIRKSVKAADGSELPILPGFAKILAGESINHPLAERVEGGYETIFASLEATGVPRDDLALAWDFVTASDDFLFADMLAMREQTLEFVGEDAANLEFDVELLNNSNPEDIRHFISGTFDVPNFLTDWEEDTSILIRDNAGLPKADGTAKANFAALVPQCVETQPLPIPVLVFGHGMFGNALDSIKDFDFLHDMIQENCVIIIGTDWIGFTNRQFAAVAFAMNDVNKGLSLSEKLQQAVMNTISLQKLTRNQLATDEAFQYNGQSIIDPDRIWYFGASLGGIMGGVYMALEQEIELGVMGVPGGPWSMLFERSAYWPPLRLTMKGAYDAISWDYAQNVAFMGLLFDKVDPMTYASRVLDNPLPDTPAKQLFLYMALGDSLVANITSETLSRALKIPITAPSVRSSYGLPEKTEQVLSAMTVYDEAVGDWPPDNNNLEGFEYNDTHGTVSELPAVQRQIFSMFFTGMVKNECRVDDEAAPCLCTTGACD